MSLALYEEIHHDFLDPERISVSLACRDVKLYKLRSSYVLNHLEKRKVINAMLSEDLHSVLTIVHEG